MLSGSRTAKWSMVALALMVVFVPVVFAARRSAEDDREREAERRRKQQEERIRELERQKAHLRVLVEQLKEINKELTARVEGTFQGSPDEKPRAVITGEQGGKVTRRHMYVYQRPGGYVSGAKRIGELPHGFPVIVEDKAKQSQIDWYKVSTYRLLPQLEGWVSGNVIRIVWPPPRRETGRPTQVPTAEPSPAESEAPSTAGQGH